MGRNLRSLRIVVSTLTVMATMLMPMASGIASATQPLKVTICHQNGSGAYVQLSVNVDGLNGHDGHTGDIIPNIQHWDAAGRAIYDNGCVVPQPTQSAETIVVRAADLSPNGWFFYNDENDAIDNTLGTFVTGPGTPPLGTGSVQISVTGSQRRNLATAQFNAGTLLSNIKTLAFDTFNPSAGNGGGANRSGYLQFNVDFTGSNTWQRRLVYVPSDNGTVTQDNWKAWDAINGGAALWRYSGATWPTTGQPGTTPKTWSQILIDYPNARLLQLYPFLGVRVGEPYADGYTENLDKIVVGIKEGLNTDTKTYDFEPTPVQCSEGMHEVEGECIPDSTPTPIPVACPSGTTESFVEHVKVNPDGNLVASGVLSSGDYLLRASGSYVYRPNSPGATLSDPAFSERDPSDAVYGGTFVPWVSVNSFPAPYQGWLGIQVNPTSTNPTSEPVPWGNVYDAGHNYSALISSWAGGAMKFRILDDVYSDNSGNLSVDIYQCKAPEAPVCNTELVTNGDFESPAITESAGWQIFTSGLIGLNWYATWLNPGPAERPEVANVELQSQNVLSGWTVAPTNGQYTELDTDWLKTGTSDGFAHSNSAIELYQNIPTETGKSYTLSFLAAARPDAPAGDNVLEALQNGISLAVLNLTDKEFKSFAYTFTAAGTTTKISFKDAGNPDDSFGPLVDNVSLKKDCAPTPQHTTYSGMKFNDANRNGIKDPGEQGLSGWTIWVGTQDEEGTHIANSMTTGADGTYTLYMPDGQVPRGGWTIGETQQTGWTQTFPEGGVYKGRQDRSESGLDFGNYQYQQPPEPLFWVEEDTTSVKVDWMPSAGADGYRVYRSNDNVTYTQIADVTGTSYTDATVAANSDHYYKVTAYQGTAENDPTTIMGKYAGTKDIVIDDNAMSADVGGSGTFAHSEGWGVYSVLTPGAETILQNAVGGDNYSTLDPYTGQTASWTTNATLDGTYEVYAQYICDPSRSQANYDIYSGTTKVGSASLIQAKNNQAGADCAPQSASTQPTWQSLGEYSFNGQGQVRLVSASPYASNGTRYILADAVGFRYIAPNCDEGQHWDGQSCVKDDDGDNGGNSQTSGLRRTHNDSLDNGTPTPTPEVTPTPTPTPAQGGGTEVTPTPTPTPTPPANPPHGNGGNGSGNKPPKNGSLGNLAAGETPTPTPSVSPSVSPLELPNPLAAAMGTGFLGLGWPWYWWLLILVIIAIIVWYWRRRK